MRVRVFALLSLVTGAVFSQTYPAKPIRLIVPFPPGGSNDIVGRMVGTQLGERLGQSVVVDNRGGAGGTIGTDMAAKAAPDGYTLLLISVAHAFNPAMYRKLPYDPEKAFAPVGMVAAGPVALMVHPAVPAHTVQELIALVKASPGRFNYATAGVGSFQHLSSALFKLQSGLDIVHIPFKGGGPAMADTIAGNTQITIGSLIQMLPHIRSGRLKALGVGSAKRVPALPDLPTISEAGVPGYEATNWWGIVAPAGTPAPIVERLYKALTEAQNNPEAKKYFDNEGATIVRMSTEEFGKFMVSETNKWEQVVKKGGIKAE
jgi:tripartite-type tricarboxylate transporter receptor subunit TctC